MTAPRSSRPTWAHPLGWLGFALGLAFGIGCALRPLPTTPSLPADGTSQQLPT